MKRQAGGDPRQSSALKQIYGKGISQLSGFAKRKIRHSNSLVRYTVNASRRGAGPELKGVLQVCGERIPDGFGAGILAFQKIMGRENVSRPCFGFQPVQKPPLSRHGVGIRLRERGFCGEKQENSGED